MSIGAESQNLGFDICRLGRAWSYLLLSLILGDLASCSNHLHAAGLASYIMPSIDHNLWIQVAADNLFASDRLGVSFLVAIHISMWTWRAWCWSRWFVDVFGLDRALGFSIHIRRNLFPRLFWDKFLSFKILREVESLIIVVQVDSVFWNPNVLDPIGWFQLHGSHPLIIRRIALIKAIHDLSSANIHMFWRSINSKLVFLNQQLLLGLLRNLLWHNIRSGKLYVVDGSTHSVTIDFDKLGLFRRVSGAFKVSNRF